MSLVDGFRSWNQCFNIFLVYVVIRFIFLFDIIQYLNIRRKFCTDVLYPLYLLRIQENKEQKDSYIFWFMMSLFLLAPIYLRDVLLVLLLVHELSIQTILNKFLRGLVENSFYRKLVNCIQPLRFAWYDNYLWCFIIKLYIRIICYLLNAMLSKNSLNFTLVTLAYTFFVKEAPNFLYNFSSFYFFNLL